MSKFILKDGNSIVNENNDIIYEGDLLSVNIKPIDSRSVYLEVETKNNEFTFKIFIDLRQGNNLNIMVDRIKEYYNKCITNNSDYIISVRSERDYIYIQSNDQDEYYNEQYTGRLVEGNN